MFNIRFFNPKLPKVADPLKGLLVTDDAKVLKACGSGSASALVLAAWMSAITIIIPTTFLGVEPERDSHIIMDMGIDKKPDPVKPKVEKSGGDKMGKPGSLKPDASNTPRPMQQVLNTSFLHLVQSRTQKANKSAFDLLGKDFIKDISKTLEHTRLVKSGNTKIASPRGKLGGLGFNEFGYGGDGDGTGEGIGKTIEALLGIGGPPRITGAGLKAKSTPVRHGEIDMGLSAAGRSLAEIQRLIRARTPGLRSVYNRYLKQVPGFSGKVNISFTITPSGEIVNAKLVASSTGVPGFDEAVLQKIMTWKFPAVKSGNTTISIPFTFSE
jgi:TonB family protein